MTHHQRSGWGLLLGLGLLFIILGTVGLSMTVQLTIASMYLFAMLFFVAGVAQCVDALYRRHWKAMLWHLVISFMYLMAGGLMIYNPTLASEIVTAFLAWILIFIGLSRTIMALRLRSEGGWGWLLFSALASFALGFMILYQWPVSGLWFIGLFIAIELLVSGWTYVLLAFALRKQNA